MQSMNGLARQIRRRTRSSHLPYAILPAAQRRLQSSVPASADVVIVGGGIIGSGVAMQLGRRGVRAVVLEQNTLTAGTTWHAAGLVGSIKGSQVVSAMAAYSAQFYKTLPEVGWHNTGSLSLARNDDEIETLLKTKQIATYLGNEVREVSREEIKVINPFVDLTGVVGGLYAPNDGIVNPADVSLAMSKFATADGATFHEGVRVNGFRTDGRRCVGVSTSAGEIACSHVLLAGGVWAPELVRMLYPDGRNRLPVATVPHQYAIFDKIDGVGNHLPVTRDLSGCFYMKPEVGGFMLGIFERDPFPTLPTVVQERNRTRVTPSDASHEVYEQDFDKFGPHFEFALDVFPALQTVGLKDTLHGPDTHSVDHECILGRLWGFDNAFVASGFNSQGIQTAPGVGLVMSEWMLDGQPHSFEGVNFAGADVMRFWPEFGEDAEFCTLRATEGYGSFLGTHYPREVMESARGRRVLPLHNKLKAKGAIFAEGFGWERAMYFPRAGEDATREPTVWASRGARNVEVEVPAYSFRARDAGWFSAEARECRLARESVGVIDLSSFGKFRVRGADALSKLQYVCTADVDRPVGSVVYTFACNDRGGIIGDLTVVRVAEDEFYLVTVSAQPAVFADHLDRYLQGVSVEEVTEDHAVIAVMGPESLGVLQGLDGGAAFDNERFPILQGRTLQLEGEDVLALRVSFVGELGWELHCPASIAPRLYDAVFESASRLGVECGDVGAYALLECLRTEKMFLHYGHDISQQHTPLEAGGAFAVKLKTEVDFLGRDALAAQRVAGIKRRLVSVELEDSSASLWGGHGSELIYRDGQVCGFLTSGGYSHTLGKPIGLGYVEGDKVTKQWIEAGTYEIGVTARSAGGVQIQRFPARVSMKALVDPKGQRFRGIYESVVPQRGSAEKSAKVFA